MVLPGKETFCDWSSLQAFLSSQPVSSASASAASADFLGSNNLEWDHVYPDLPTEPSSSTVVRPSVVLYGIIGSSSFCQLHTALKAEPGISSYTVRHAYSSLSPHSNRYSVRL